MENNSLKEAFALIDLLDFTMESAISSQIQLSSSNGHHNRSIPFLGMRSILNSLRSELININKSVGISEHTPINDMQTIPAAQVTTATQVSQAMQSSQMSQAPVRVKTIPQEARGRVRELVGYSELEE